MGTDDSEHGTTARSAAPVEVGDAGFTPELNLSSPPRRNSRNRANRPNRTNRTNRTYRSDGEAARADVSQARRFTAVSLWFVHVSFGASQIALSLTDAGDTRFLILVLLTVASLVAAFAITPRLLDGLAGNSAHHPLVYTLMVLGLATWTIANTTPFAGWSWSLSTIVAAGIAACLLPLVRRIVVITGMVAVVVLIRSGSVVLSGGAVDWRSFGGSDPFAIVAMALLLLIPITYLSTVWGLEVVVRLDRARLLASELAIARERLRFATDLHDIQGHNLQVIALKSELAERLLAVDTVRSADELAQIRAIAQQALDDTRAVVNDYRTVTVAVEVRNAAAILRSAGIDCSIRIDTVEFAPEIGTVLAVAVREATTNLLRHSSATVASIELVTLESPPALRLTVHNDGASPARGGGNGLRGLAERVATVGGSVSGERDGAEFTVTVLIPLGERQHPGQQGHRSDRHRGDSRRAADDPRRAQ